MKSNHTCKYCNHYSICSYAATINSMRLKFSSIIDEESKLDNGVIVEFTCSKYDELFVTKRADNKRPSGEFAFPILIEDKKIEIW